MMVVSDVTLAEMQRIWAVSGGRLLEAMGLDAGGANGLSGLETQPESVLRVLRFVVEVSVRRDKPCAAR